jgi:hypothetical protein
MRLAAALVGLLAACSQACTVASPNQSAASAARTSTSPTSVTPAAVPGVYAVMVKDFLVEGGPDYTVSLVATDGQVVAGSTVPKRSVFAQIGNVSTSNTTLYYLDGDSDIRFLRPDGEKGIATHVALGPKQVVAFSVSPDDRRVAVSVLDYTRYPVSTRLYVEDLNGGGNHVELFSSPTVLEWPAGWHNGNLVMAIGLNARPQNAYEGFLRGHGYHVADAQSGARIRSLCDGGDSSVPESPAGTVCYQSQKATVVSWDGSSRPVAQAGLCAVAGPLSPAGMMATRIVTYPDGSCGGGSTVYLVKADGSQDTHPLAQKAEPQGWMDATHLVVRADLPPATSPGTPPAQSVVDIANGTAAPILAQGFFAAALPGGL